MIDSILLVFFIVSIFTFILWTNLALLPDRNIHPTQPLKLSVVMPAHDEEAVIESTVKSVLKSDYFHDFEVLVVDDGSKDKTAEVVKRLLGEDSRVRLLETDHVGKAAAVNLAVKKSKGDVVVLLDADSELDRKALERISRPFSDPLVGAVSGIIRVKVNWNILTWFQEFEYVLSSMWRHIFDKVDCTYVLPGFAAFRKTALQEVSLFESDTLSEDFDIGLKLHKSGWKVQMSYACMYTNVPQTLLGLAKQRLRWGRGTVQVIRKHRDMLLNPRYGFIGLYGLPNQIYFFIQSFIVLPITFYQIFGGYMRWYVSHGNYLSAEVARYFFASFSMYGTLEFAYKVLSGIWPMTEIFPYFLASYVVNQLYSLLAVKKMASLNYRIPFVLFFLFPYYLITLVFFIYPFILELNPLRQRRSYVNIWEKNR